MTDGNQDLAVRRVTGTGVAVRGDDINTDQIYPARFMKTTTWDEVGEYAFYDQRRTEDGEQTAHPFNEYHGASILVVNDNFGCGSSREHAPRALQNWGIDGIVGESFAEIFRDNCKSIGIPAARAASDVVSGLQDFIEANPDAGLELDVVNERVVYAGEEVAVDIEDGMQEALIEGIWDTVTLMRSNLDEVHEVASSLPYIDG